MRISSSDVQLEARHQRVAQEEERASLRVTVGDRTREVGIARTAQSLGFERVQLSAMAQHARAGAALNQSVALTLAAHDAEKPAATPPADEKEKTREPPELRLFRLAVEAMLGRKIRPAPAIEVSDGSEEIAPSDASAAAEPAWEVAYDESRSYSESEYSSVSATGVVNTADGKQIAFAMQVTMQRSYHESESTSIRMGNARLKDPLVLQFEGTAAQLQQGTFAFDIDADGALDNIHFMADGSAALALDANGNGTIDDGSELFGTRTGDGFAELAAHDADANGWIDEADPIFDQLRLWSRSEDGQSRLSSLQERGVGAIYLGNVSSPFEIKNASNELQGVVRATSVWLSEDGVAKPIQQIDLVV